jgi:hypothetical protein
MDCGAYDDWFISADQGLGTGDRYVSDLSPDLRCILIDEELNSALTEAAIGKQAHGVVPGAPDDYGLLGSGQLGDRREVDLGQAELQMSKHRLMCV